MCRERNKENTIIAIPKNVQNGSSRSPVFCSLKLRLETLFIQFPLQTDFSFLKEPMCVVLSLTATTSY